MEIELEFARGNIPFIVRGGLRFFENAHIKDLLSFLVILANERDELAWQRVLAMCNRVGPKTIANVITKLRAATEAEGGPLNKFISNGVADSARGLGKASLKELQQFLAELSTVQESLPVSELLRRIIEERYRSYLELKYENWRQRLDDLEQLLAYAGKFPNMTDFLRDVGLNGSFSGTDLSGAYRDDDHEEGAVTLSTIHQAKGLEWNTVFVVHVQDDVIPHRMSRDSEEGEAEERRLLYVAVTRAEEMLFLSYPQIVQTHDFQRLINKLSRFLDKLPADCYDHGELDWE